MAQFKTQKFTFFAPRTVIFREKVLRGTKKVKVRPRMAVGAHRVLTIEVWHQTSGCKGTKFLRKAEMASAEVTARV